jgi:hypothetical protein
VYWFSHDVVIPEPASVGLIAMASLGLIAARRRMCRA